MSWPLLEQHMRAYLADTLGVEVATRVPDDVHERESFVRIARGPGSDDGYTDKPLLDVETFAPSEVAAAQLAEQARSALHALKGGRHAGGILVDRITTATGPVFVHYSPSVARYVASYRIEYRQ